MRSYLTFTFLLVTFFTACQSQKEKSAKAYEEGLKLSKEAHTAYEKGDAKTANDLHSKAIAQYKEALQFDSTNKQIRGEMAASYYESSNYKDALDWYTKATAQDGEKAAYYRNMGIIKVKTGELEPGKDLLEKSVSLDHSAENRDAVVKALTEAGKRQFEEGKATKVKGNMELAKKQQNDAMSVLMMAYYYDNTRKDVAAIIAQYADEIGDNTVKVQYTKLSQQ